MKMIKTVLLFQLLLIGVATSLQAQTTSCQSPNTRNVVAGVGYPQLLQNEPNPFNSSTLIRYYLPSAISNAVLKITDSNGKELGSYRLVNTGHSYVNVETEYISSGVYVYSLLVGDKVVDSKKMIVGQ